MEIGVLVIPAFGGYLFLTNTYATRFEAYRESGYHLIFKSVIAGLILFAISYPIAGVISPFFSSISAPYIAVSRIWGQFSPTDLSAFVLSLLLGKFSPYCINRFYYSSERAIERVLKKEGSQTELILKAAFDAKKLVEISLKNRKSYVGLVVAFDVAPRDNKQDVAILPAMSGYRDKDTFRLQFTTNYITKDCMDRDLGGAIMRVVMPMPEIATVRLFDFEVYERLNP